MDVVSFLMFFGGLGLLLYGMNVMGGGLEKFAGDRLEKTLEKMTGNLIKSVALGALVTGIIQTSTGTTVMVVGFVNAGIMSLKQAVGVIMGANIGTTVTAQIISLDGSGAGMAFLEYLKPSIICYFIIAVGAVLLLFVKKSKVKTLGEIFLGLGMLFLGIAVMESSVSALRDLPAFQQMFTTLKNPVIAMLVGSIVTAILHSSTASVGILQAAASSGLVTYAAAVPIIMGQNIGTCITALTSSVGSNKNAKRAALIHFYFNLIGSVIFIMAIYGLNAVIGFSFWDESITKGAIANFHTVFNITTTLIFLPFHKLLIKLAEKTIRSGEGGVEDDLAILDPRFYQTPSIALEQCHKAAIKMGEVAYDSFIHVNDAILDKKPFLKAQFLEKEDFLDRSEARLNAYMVGMNDAELSDTGKRQYAEIMHAIGDFERIGDYCENLMDQYLHIGENNIAFSNAAIGELRLMSAACDEILRLTNQCYSAGSADTMPRIQALEDIIDTMKETLKSRHISRLQAGKCTVQNGIPFLDIIHNYEKISDHCANISIYVAMVQDEEHNFDVHEFKKAKAGIISAEYKSASAEYDGMYVSPLGKRES